MAQEISEEIKALAESLKANSSSSLTDESSEETPATEQAQNEGTTEQAATPESAEESSQEKPTEDAAPDFSKYEAEIAELKKQLEGKTPLNKTGNKLIDRLLELHEKNQAPESEDELQLAFRPLDSVDTKDLEVSRELLMESLIKEKGYTKQEAIDELEYEYPQLFEEDPDADSKEYKANERRFTRAASEYLQRLKEKQKSLELPKPERLQIAEKDVQANFSKMAQELYTQRVQARTPLAEKIVTGREKTVIKFDDLEVHYEPSKETLSKIRQDIADIENTGASFVKPDGTPDESGLFQWFAFKHDAKTILKAYGDYRASQGKKETTKEIKNADFSEKKPAPTKTLPVPDNHQLAGPLKAIMGIKD